MAKTDIYVAKESFVTTLDGREIVVNKGTTRVRDGHPLLKGKANLFELLKVQYDTEQATAAPEEKRGRRSLAETPAEATTETPEASSPESE